MPARASGAEVGAAFADLAEILAEDSDIETYLAALCRRGVSLTGASCAALVYLEDPASPDGEFGLASSDDLGAALAGPSPYAAGEPWSECLRTGQLSTVANLQAKAGAWPRFAEAATSAGLTALTLLPVTGRGVSRGTLALLGTGLPDATGIALGLALAGAAGAGLASGAELRRLRDTVTQLQTALTSRVVIEQAKGMLAERWRISPDEAFATLRRHARAARQSLAEVASGVVSGSVTPVRAGQPGPPRGPR